MYLGYVSSRHCDSSAARQHVEACEDAGIVWHPVLVDEKAGRVGQQYSFGGAIDADVDNNVLPVYLRHLDWHVYVW